MSKILASALTAVTLVTAGAAFAQPQVIPTAPRQPTVQPQPHAAPLRPTASPSPTPIPVPYTPPPPRYIATPSIAPGPTGGLMGGVQLQMPKATVGVTAGELRPPAAPAAAPINPAVAGTISIPAQPAVAGPDRSQPSPSGGPIPGSSNNVVR